MPCRECSVMDEHLWFVARLLEGEAMMDAGREFGVSRHYDLGYIDLEQKTLQTIDNPFGTRLSPMS
jgi:hypothetical protein